MHLHNSMDNLELRTETVAEGHASRGHGVSVVPSGHPEKWRKLHKHKSYKESVTSLCDMHAVVTFFERLS